MGPEYQRTVTAALKSNADGGDPPPNNPLYLSAIRAAADDPAKFANTDLTPLLPHLPKADWNKLQQKQAFIIQHGAASPKAVTYANIDKIVSDLAPGAGLVLGKPKAGVDPAPPSPIGAPMATRLRVLHDGIQADVDNYHAAHKTWPTLEQVQAMGARRVVQVTLPGTGGLWGLSPDNKALLGELAPNTRYTLAGANVPARDRSQIVSAWHARYGAMPNDAQIADVYTRKAAQ